MQRRPITACISIKLAFSLAVLGCGSGGEGTPTGTAATATAGTAGSPAGVAGTAAAGGPSDAGSGGAAGTSGAATTTAGSAPIAGGGAAGAGGSIEPAGGTGGVSMQPTSGGEAPCTDSALKAGNTTTTIQYAGGNRDYIMHVPSSYNGKTRVPLLIDMHGSGQTAGAQMGTGGWNPKADKEGFLVVYPNALNMRWNAGTCCSPSVEQNVDDVGFLRAVVEKVKKDACIDRKRVYASGLSGGGLMSYRLACEVADVFAAVAPVSGATVFSPCKPSIPVSVVAFRGLNDDLVPYNGGMPLKWYFQGAKADFNQWSMLDTCAGPVTMSHGICQTNTQCASGSDVTLCSVNGGHVLYGDAANAGAAVPDVAWEIFQRHQLP